MTKAGDLTQRQLKLWKRAEQHNGLASMDGDELRDWARACRTRMISADSAPAKSAKARRLWRGRLAEAEAVLDAREQT